MTSKPLDRLGYVGRNEGVKRVFAFSLILLLLTSIAIFVIQYNSYNLGKEEDPFYLGVTFCGNTTSEAAMLIDRVKTYTNLFILQSGPTSKNETAVNEICDYAVASGLHIIVYFGWFDPDYPWQIPWLNFAKQQWADRFLGVYYYDEPGGIQIDIDWAHWLNRLMLLNSTLLRELAPIIEEYINGTLPRDYDAAANRYIDAIRIDPGLKELKTREITSFVSDYALYWFDYLGGFDVVFAQFGWNGSVVQDIALVRGAARMQNRKWGAIITWKYEGPPYLDTGDEIYRQMSLAYEAGAKYVMIFNYPQINDNPYGIMNDDHFEALERFWTDMVKNRDAIHGSAKAEAALVLPGNYGWGMRYPNDRIWFWGPDERSPQIWELSRKLLSQYGHQLDIVYEDTEFPVTNQYEEIYDWNDSI
jgi:hypothetical protein